jgi:hypothetical protein
MFKNGSFRPDFALLVSDYVTVIRKITPKWEKGNVVTCVVCSPVYLDVNYLKGLSCQSFRKQ